MYSIPRIKEKVCCWSRCFCQQYHPKLPKFRAILPNLRILSVLTKSGANCLGFPVTTSYSSPRGRDFGIQQAKVISCFRHGLLVPGQPWSLDWLNWIPLREGEGIFWKGNLKFWKRAIKLRKHVKYDHWGNWGTWSLSLCTFTFFCRLKIIRSFGLKKEKRRKGANEGFEKKIKKKSSLTLKWEAHPNIPALIWSPLWGSLSKPKGPSSPRAGLPASASADRPSELSTFLSIAMEAEGYPFLIREWMTVSAVQGTTWSRLREFFSEAYFPLDQ